MAPGTEAADRFRGLSLVMPAFNEAQTIALAIREADHALRALGTDHEVIVVDDGSSDATGAEVCKAMTLYPAVRMVKHARNLGYGAALRSGFTNARFPLVAVCDADCQFDLAQLNRMLPLSAEADIVCGYRVGRQDPAYRRFLSWGYNRLIGWLLGSAVRDCDCALKVFRRDALLRVLPEADNFFANAEILWRARRNGLMLVEIGVLHRPRASGRSKVSIWDVPRTLATLLPFWWSRHRHGLAGGGR